MGNFEERNQTKKSNRLLLSSAAAKQWAHILLLFHPIHWLSHIYRAFPVLDVVTTCGDADESLTTHRVLELGPGAGMTILSTNNREALDHNDCSTPSDRVPAIDLYGMDKECWQSFVATFDRVHSEALSPLGA